MGCFLGCFGGGKDGKRRGKRSNRGSHQRQRNRVQNVQQESVITAEQSTNETTPVDLDSEFRNKAEGVAQLSPSPKKRVTFNSNVTTYEHVSIHESIDSQPDCAINTEKEKKPEDLTLSQQSHSLSGDDNSVISSVGLYPPNHRYHNARESDDEAEEYSDSDLDDWDDEDQYDDDDDEDCDKRISSQEVRSESFTTESLESRTGNHSAQGIEGEVESLAVKSQPSSWEVEGFGNLTNARDRSDYVHSVLKPVENVTQWKAAKSKGSSHSLKQPQKENLTANFDAPHISFSSEPTMGKSPFSFKKRSDQLKISNQEMAVDASLSNWLVSSEMTTTLKRTNFGGGLETIVSGQTSSEGRTSARSYEDRPILGALTVDELKQMSPSPSPRKSPSRSPDEMPIIGTVGTYWNPSGWTKHSDPTSSFKGVPITTSKYRGI